MKGYNAYNWKVAEHYEICHQLDMMQPPCKDCKNRFYNFQTHCTCHSTCIKYLKFKQKRDELLKEKIWR